MVVVPLGARCPANVGGGDIHLGLWLAAFAAILSYELGALGAREWCPGAPDAAWAYWVFRGKVGGLPLRPSKPREPPAPLWRRLGWLPLSWAASVLIVGLVPLVIRVWLL